ncbi:hypothetical protein HZY97_20140 [Sphingomonas sp. R-74633]|uniref:hypothetical protein n=1 Tax=Sphingomonas sp. R-74633 TaxID=2751188 RepID=UPI0015D3922E|nr:hypothetical protein [Sphingomonas sp. R-74633]NYT43096.1 hypothetical protein [Sphingomonas sp. R-74633]
MSDAGGVSAGEVGGIIAGAIAILAALGKGAAWLLNWKDARANSRSAKLQVWHDELTSREAKLDAEIASRLTRIEEKYERLEQHHFDVLIRFERQRNAYRVLAAEVIAVAPHSAALIQAQMILEEAMPVPSMAGGAQLLDDIDTAEGPAT